MTETLAPNAAPTFGQAARNGNGEMQAEFLEATDLLGSMGFADAFPRPVTIQYDGKEYILAPLSNDDYGPWLDEIWAKLKPQRLATLAGLTNANALERWKIATNIEETELTPDDFMAYILVPKWGKRVALRVLEKAGMTQEQQEFFLQKRPVKANEMFAVYFSGLYTVHFFNMIYQRVTANQYKKPPVTFGGQSAPFVAAPDSSSGSRADSEGATIGHSPVTESKASPAEVLTA